MGDQYFGELFSTGGNFLQIQNLHLNEKKIIPNHMLKIWGVSEETIQYID